MTRIPARRIGAYFGLLAALATLAKSPADTRWLPALQTVTTGSSAHHLVEPAPAGMPRSHYGMALCHGIDTSSPLFGEEVDRVWRRCRP